MKIRDFIKLNADIDVYDNVCETQGICFCGPAKLTEEGEKHFAEVLDYDIELDFSGDIKTAAVDVDCDDWKHKKHMAEKFFYALAGYCPVDDYNKWFCDIDYGQYASDPTAMMYITVYCDTALYDKDNDKCWYTYDEMMQDNMCELSFPRKMVQEYYEADKDCFDEETMEELGVSKEDCTFEAWITGAYTADSTDGLFSFCADHGFIAVREE